MKDNKEQSTREDMRIADFSQLIAFIFVTVVIVGSVISILFF